jgi:CheY-like chemotaxis protein
VAQRLRAQGDTSGIPLIAATGYSHARQLDLARQSGFDAVVVKPCDPDMLVQEIERLLASGPVSAQPDHSGVEQPYNNR